MKFEELKNSLLGKADQTELSALSAFDIARKDKKTELFAFDPITKKIATIKKSSKKTHAHLLIDILGADGWADPMKHNRVLRGYWVPSLEMIMGYPTYTGNTKIDPRKKLLAVVAGMLDLNPKKYGEIREI